MENLLGIVQSLYLAFRTPLPQILTIWSWILPGMAGSFTELHQDIPESATKVPPHCGLFPHGTAGKRLKLEKICADKNVTPAGCFNLLQRSVQANSSQKLHSIIYNSCCPVVKIIPKTTRKHVRPAGIKGTTFEHWSICRAAELWSIRIWCAAEPVPLVSRQTSGIQ